MPPILMPLNTTSNVYTHTYICTILYLLKPLECSWKYSYQLFCLIIIYHNQLLSAVSQSWGKFLCSTHLHLSKHMFTYIHLYILAHIHMHSCSCVACINLHQKTSILCELAPRCFYCETPLLAIYVQVFRCKMFMIFYIPTAANVHSYVSMYVNCLVIL